MQNAALEPPLAVSAILRRNSVTVSGPSSSLRRFLDELPDGCRTVPVQVHALYHGGEGSKQLMDRVVHDLRRAGVVLPASSQLSIPFRKASDKSAVSSCCPPSDDLVTEIVESILVLPVNWPQTLETMELDISMRVNQPEGPLELVRLVSYGPSSPLMLSGLQDMSSKTNLERVKVDLSHENTEIQTAASYISSETDIAIIGVGFNFPNGSNLEDFWRSLLDGQNFAKEVRGYSTCSGTFGKRYGLTSV